MMKTKLIALYAVISLSWSAIAQEPNSSLVQRLADLSELYEQGLLSEAEFAAAKEVVLSNNNQSTNRADALDSSLLTDNDDTPADEGSPELNSDSSAVVISESKEGVETTPGQRKVRKPENDESGNQQAQIILQGNLITMDTLSSQEQAISGALGAVANLATGGIAGAVAESAIRYAIQETLTNPDSQTYIPVEQNILDEVQRVTECYAVESGYDVSEVHIIPSNPAYYTPRLTEGYESITSYWEDYLELDNAWSIDASTNTVMWVFYTLIVPNEFNADNLSDLELATASSFILPVSTENWQAGIHRTDWLTNNGYGLPSFQDFITQLVPEYTPSFPHPDCGLRSAVLLKLKEEINEESDISDIESFFESLNVRYERDRSKRTLSGVLALDNQDVTRIDYPVKIEIFHTRRPRRFERAVVTNIYD